MKPVEKILVVGGGIGGLSAAIALRRRGFAVDLVEVKPEWTVYGVGIIVQCNVVRAIAQLGILDSFLDTAYSFDTVSIYRTDGGRIATIPGHRLAGPDIRPMSACRAGRCTMCWWRRRPSWAPRCVSASPSKRWMTTGTGWTSCSPTAGASATGW
nr:FAD-dependent monooxygenase [Azospirillum sp. B506]